jgi:Uma2 family endonuclease
MLTGMAEAASETWVSYADYLRIEQEAGVKHQWIDGEVFAMVGGTPEHARLQLAIGRVLGNALEGGPCVAFSADLRVRSRATNIATYADITVVCGGLETDPDDRNAATNPTLLIEVLSPSTEAYDRGQKAAHYRRIPSVREYVLVSQDAARIEVFRRAEGGRWIFVEAGAGETLTLESVGCTLVIDELFAGRISPPPADG